MDKVVSVCKEILSEYINKTVYFIGSLDKKHMSVIPVTVREIMDDDTFMATAIVQDCKQYLTLDVLSYYLTVEQAEKEMEKYGLKKTDKGWLFPGDYKKEMEKNDR